MLLLLQACASGPQFNEVAAVHQGPAAGLGRIYGYRIGSPFGAAIQPAVKLNGEKIGEAVPGGFFFADRPPGNYTVSTETEVERTQSLTLEAGQVRYVRFEISMGFMVGHVSPTLVEPAVGASEIASLHYTGNAPGGTVATNVSTGPNPALLAVPDSGQPPRQEASVPPPPSSPHATPDPSVMSAAEELAVAPLPPAKPVEAPAPAPVIADATPPAPLPPAKPVDAPVPAPVVAAVAPPAPPPQPVELPKAPPIAPVAIPAATPQPVTVAALPVPAAEAPAARIAPSARVPFLADEKQQKFVEYLSRPKPRAFAISDNGHFASVWGIESDANGIPVDARTRALAGCKSAAGRDCFLFAVDDTVVYFGAPYTVE